MSICSSVLLLPETEDIKRPALLVGLASGVYHCKIVSSTDTQAYTISSRAHMCPFYIDRTLIKLCDLMGAGVKTYRPVG